MKQALFLIILAVAAYFGYQKHQEHQTPQSYIRLGDKEHVSQPNNLQALPHLLTNRVRQPLQPQTAPTNATGASTAHRYALVMKPSFLSAIAPAPKWTAIMTASPVSDHFVAIKAFLTTAIYVD